MRYVKVAVILIFIFLCNLLWADFFPIGGYGCKRLYQADSCHLNTAQFAYDPSNPHKVDTLLDRAETLNMKVILSRAKEHGTALRYNIVSFSGGQNSMYEAESTDFSHKIGEKVYDQDASGDTAWVACATGTDWLQYNLWTNEQYHNWMTFEPDHSLGYYAYFILKTNDTTETNPVCSLLIRRKEDSTVICDTFLVLTGQDFSDIGVYDTFVIEFKLAKDEGKEMDYAIKYLGTNDSLYSDKVDVWDAIADSLKKGKYGDYIVEIAEYYNQKTAMYRYYMQDEPSPDQYYASKEVNGLLKEQNDTIGGIQAMCWQDRFKTYLDSVNTDELFVDCYPLYGGTCTWSYTPVDSGLEFHERIDCLCEFLGEAREIVKSATGKKFWFIPQAFGQGLSDSDSTWDPVWNTTWLHDSTKTGWWREPSPREMRCMVWLGLAYGAKGICYYLYHSYHHYFSTSGYVWDVGLTNASGSTKRPIWSTIQSINQELDSIGDVLLTLESDKVFKYPGIPLDCFIDTISLDDTVQVGTFHNTDNDTFFIVVNRLCQASDSDTVIMRIKKDSLFLLDLYTAEAISADSIKNDKAVFSIPLTPGQGRCFQLVPFAQDFKINDN